MDELVVTIAKILKNLTFEPTKKSRNAEVQVNLTISVKGGMQLVPKLI